MRNFYPGISPGWKWDGSEFAFNKQWELDDIYSNEPLDVRSTRVVLEAMNSVMPFLNLTAEWPSDYPDNRLPTLDCSIFVEDGLFLHSFFEKLTRSSKSLDAATALPAIFMRTSLIQEFIRRLTNIHPLVGHEEKVLVLNKFCNKLYSSGHKVEIIQFIVVEAFVKFKHMLYLDNLPRRDPNHKPLYMSNDYNRNPRKINKFLSQFNWYVPGSSSAVWKQEIPRNLQLLNRQKQSFGSRRWSAASTVPTSVLFVPNSYNGILLKRLEEKEPLLTKLSGYCVRLVESSGIPLSRLFSLDMSDGRCHRYDCLVCMLFSGKGSSKCRKNSVVYESSCISCKAIGSTQSTYIGETGRSLFERSLEHIADDKAEKPGSHIYKHWALHHSSELVQPVFQFKVLRVHQSCLDRQVHEGIRIAMDGSLNSKCEWRQNQIKRIAVQLTDKELRVERWRETLLMVKLK